MLVYAWACSDVGRKRSNNQDAYLIAQDLKLFAVADGMGGHKGGEVASAVAVETLESTVRAHAHNGLDAVTRLAASVQAANARIHALAKSDGDLDNMGTTTTSLLMTGSTAVIAHVGDSRIYLIRSDRILQLTDDHSIVWQQMKAGLITAAQAKQSPFRSIISRSVGVERAVDVDIITLEVQSADTFVICSDGLSGVVEDDEICRIVNDNFLHRAPALLVDLANERGGPDNVTVVVAYAIEEREICGAVGEAR